MSGGGGVLQQLSNVDDFYGGILLGYAEQFRLGLEYRLSAFSRREATPLRGVAPASARLCRQVHLPAQHSPYAVVEHGFSCCVISMKKRPPRGPLFHTHGGSRTHDPLLRRQLLYPTELRERCGANIEKNFKFTPIIKKIPLPIGVFLLYLCTYQHICIG